MSSPISRSSPDSGVLPMICSGVISAVVLAIIFIALGALGAQGTIYMAPIGAEIMITIGTAIIIGMITTVMKSLCR